MLVVLYYPDPRDREFDVAKARRERKLESYDISHAEAVMAERISQYVPTKSLSSKIAKGQRKKRGSSDRFHLSEENLSALLMTKVLAFAEPLPGWWKRNVSKATGAFDRPDQI